MDDGTTGEMAGRDRLSGGKDWHPEIGHPKGDGQLLIMKYLECINPCLSLIKPSERANLIERGSRQDERANLLWDLREVPRRRRAPSRAKRAEHKYNKIQVVGSVIDCHRFIIAPPRPPGTSSLNSYISFIRFITFFDITHIRQS
jgi:hypothetical protein